jgi:hypothetical protein
MARNVNQALWEQWRGRIERQRESGLSIAAFCRREGVSMASFHGWKRKLRQSASASLSSRHTAPSRPRTNVPQEALRRDQETPHAPTSSAATTRPANFFQVPILGVQTAPWIEMVLVDGTVIRVPQQNLAALHTVLHVLRGGQVEALIGEVPHA